MTYANLYAIFFGIFVIWFSFSSVCSLVLDHFAGDAFVAGDTNKIDTGGKIDKVYLIPDAHAAVPSLFGFDDLVRVASKVTK